MLYEVITNLITAILLAPAAVKTTLTVLGPSSTARITSYNVCYTKLLRADNGGNVKEGISTDEAAELKAKFEEAGATIELK